MKSNHDLVVLNRDQLCEEDVQRDSKIMIKRNYKDETDCSTGSSENQERHGSFLRNAILKDEERRQIQMQDASRGKDAINFHGQSRRYGEQIMDSDKEERTLQFRRFVEQTSEVEDDIKGESQNEDDEKDDDDDSEDDDSDDEKVETDEHGTSSKKRKTYRVKPDPKYNGMTYPLFSLCGIQ